MSQMKKNNKIFYRLLLLSQLLLAIASVNAEEDKTDSDWISLFNGKNLEGWTVKINGQAINQDKYNTFRAEDGILKVSYDNYKKFDMQFGHIFTNIPYSHYIFRLEYKFTGKGLADAPHWTNRNSGIMFHAQSPLSMRIDQGFPVCLEAQFLAEGATAGTQTGNAVTPGTHIHINDALTKDHIIDSKSKLYPMDTWVAFEIEVHGNEWMAHRVNGKEVLRYTKPVLDQEDKDAQYLMKMGAARQLSEGFIALQAEAQPVWFRNIQIKVLSEN